MKKCSLFAYVNRLSWLCFPLLALTTPKPAFLRPYAYSKPMDGFYLVYQQHYFGLLDLTGHQIVPCQFDDISRFSEGMAEVVLNGHHGYINRQGKLVIPLIYTRANAFQNGEALVVTSVGDVGYLNTRGQAVAAFSQLGRPYFRGRYAKGWAWQPYIGHQARESTGEFYQSVEAVPADYVPQEMPATQKFRSSGLTLIFVGEQQHRRYGFADSMGRLDVPLLFDDASETEYSWKGWVRIKKNERYGFLDRQSGKIVIPIIYEDSQPSNYDHIWVKQHGQWGCIDRNSQVVIPFQYAAVSAYSEQRVIVKSGNHFGYADTTGKLITAIQFDQASHYQQGKAKVYRGNDWFELDSQGHVLKRGLQGDIFWIWVRYALFLGGIALFLFLVYRRKIRLIV